MARDLVYERELRVRAAPETIFELLTDAQAFSSWMGFDARLEAREGGHFELDLGERAQVRGRYLVVDAPRRVVFSWGWEGGVIPLAPGESTVEFTLVPDGEHTLVRFKHSGLSPALREFHAWGWSRYLPRLVAVAEGREPSGDPMGGGPPAEVLRRLLESED